MATAASETRPFRCVLNGEAKPRILCQKGPFRINSSGKQPPRVDRDARAVTKKRGNGGENKKKRVFKQGCRGGHDNLNDVVTLTFLVIM